MGSTGMLLLGDEAGGRPTQRRGGKVPLNHDLEERVVEKLRGVGLTLPSCVLNQVKQVLGDERSVEFASCALRLLDTSATPLSSPPSLVD